MRAEPRAGFSLIEMLVALLVFSLAVVALLNLTGESTRVAVSLEQRVLAGVVADNRAVEALTDPVAPPVGETSGEEVAADRSWAWQQVVTETAEAGVLRVDVRVSERPGGPTLAEVTAFRGRR